MWAKAVDQRQCTVLEPNDRVKSAVMRARERSEIDKVRKRQQHVSGYGGGDILDEVRELQKSVLMAQLHQLNGGLAANQPASWVPFEYKFWAEIMAHTDNFLEYFAAK